MIRYALAYGEAREIAALLPRGYEIVARASRFAERPAFVIAGRDACGWTLDEYVIPRLASALICAEEIAHAGDIPRNAGTFGSASARE